MSRDEPPPIPASESNEEYFVLGPHGVQFTPAGLRRYQQRFGWAGYEIENIMTLDEFEAALRASWPFEQTRVYDWLSQRTSGDALERRALLAVAHGEPSEIAAALSMLKARRSARGA